MIIDRDSPIPQYFQLQTWLIEQIEQGVFRENEKIPTEEEFVKITGLARATIRQAVQNLVNMGYLRRRRRLGTFVLEHDKVQSKATIIGILVADIRSGYTPELARGAGDEAAKTKHSIILCNTDDLFIKADFYADRLIEHGVSGVIFVPTASSDEKNLQIINKLTRNGIPVVLADRQVPGADVDCITTDNFNGGWMATNYLMDKGHRNIAILLSTLFSTERERLHGYLKAHSDRNISINESNIFTHDERFNESFYIEPIKKILHSKKEVTAVFAGHDRIAYLIYSLAAESGLRIPQDLSVIGYDDLPFSKNQTISLTTMHQPIYEMGQESMRIILNRIQKRTTEPGNTKVLSSHLVERESVRSI
jgi:DNA-binding LacI/PurR family transcriptional regulator